MQYVPRQLSISLTLPITGSSLSLELPLPLPSDTPPSSVPETPPPSSIPTSSESLISSSSISESSSITESSSIPSSSSTESSSKITSLSSSQPITSSLPLTSSSEPIPTTPPPPPPPPSSLSSLDLETPSPSFTTSYTTVTTSSNGQLITYTSPLPTSLFTSPPSDAAMHRSSIIAGATTGAVVLLLLILGAIFAYRRRKLRSMLELLGKKKEAKGLLDGEGFDDDDVPMGTYSDRGVTGALSINSIGTRSSPPSLYRARASETGSIFHEGVWPPPGSESRFVDPFLDGVRASSQVDLNNIVNDIMGPSAEASTSQQRHERNPSGSSSATSYSGLPPSSMLSLSDPSPISTSHSIENPPVLPPPSFQSNPSPQSLPQLPPGALSPSIPSGVPYRLTIPSYEEQQAQKVKALALKASAQPATSSPLARASPTEEKLWIHRRVGSSDSRTISNDSTGGRNGAG